MNTITELLMTEINTQRIADRHAEADARRLAATVTPAERPAHGWSVSSLFRRASLNRRAARAF